MTCCYVSAVHNMSGHIATPQGTSCLFLRLQLFGKANRRPNWLLRFFTLAAVLVPLLISAQENVITNGATWRWQRGTNEASTPFTAWRTNGFNDSAWFVGPAPFSYGANATGRDDGVTTGTVVSNMINSFRCIFLRCSFVITNVAEIQAVTFNTYYDDGFVAWINGVPVLQQNMPTNSPAYTNFALVAHEADPAVLLTVTNSPQSYLVVGTNTLAVQVFNNQIASSDLRFETTLQITKGIAGALALTNVFPAASASLGALTQITLWFNKPVYGVEAQDFLVNGQPADSVAGTPGTNCYTFSFTQPAPGLIGIGWSEAAAITDILGGPFDLRSTNANWTYTLADGMAPVIAERTPVAGALVGQLSQVEMVFSEAVVGVSAGDLRLNGITAVSVTGTEAGPYVFQFAPPIAGTAFFTWAAGHGIADLAGNAFVGTNWSVTFNPGVAPGDVIINEFVVGNVAGLVDEDASHVDWIELYNRGTNAVNLLGWSLTDNANVPGLWTFPAKILNPGEFLVVYASGKDRRAPTGTNRFHTNFKLDLFGEYLGLFNAESPRIAVSEFNKYPEQHNDYSFGLDTTTNAWRYFAAPTPGAPNGSSAVIAVAPEPHFSVTRGFFAAPFNLLLTTPVSGATIRYTTDGSEPTAVNGLVYSAPLTITNTTILRAATFAAGYVPSRTRTHSYLYLDSVLSQPNNPPGFPATWGTYASFSNNIVPADYEMDLDPLRVDPNDPGSAVDPEKLQRFQEGLRELPVVSLSIDPADMFNSTGMYYAANVTSKTYPEKQCSVEMVLPDGTTAFAVSGGLSIHGNASREPRKNPKHGFRLSFKGEYGESALKYPLFLDSPAQEFDDLIVRADFGTSWRHQSDTADEPLGAFQRTRATRTRDAWWKHTLRDMGHPSSHSRYFHLFINGLYWGTYDFTEQPNENFGPNYFGGASADYDVYEQGILDSGTATAYTAMTGITGLSNNANYELMKQYLDIPEFVDYMLLHFFVGAQDWGDNVNKNWFAIRKRVSGPEGTFKYLPWDGENLLLETSINRVTAGSPPSGLHPKLDDNAQYRLDFADRVHKHMIAPDGALQPAANIERWAYWMNLLNKPIVAESCRWGDYRRDVHNYAGFTSGAYVLYTREEHWLAESNRIVNTYLPGRNATVLSQLRAVGLYPAIDAPEYRQGTIAGTVVGNSKVGAGYVVAMNNPGGAGVVYYTTNGADPRVIYSGAVAAAALTYATPLTLNASVTLKSRILNGGVWSALNEVTFTVGELGLPLRFTEIMYNPVGGDAYEFIELQNVGALPLDLGGFSFDGITCIIPEGTLLPPGAVLLLASGANPAAFAVRYPSVAVSGYFSGTLANGGDRIALLDKAGNTVVAVHYDDEAGWPTSPDGGGDSLEIIDPRGDPNAPSNWRASSSVNGTPGLPPIAPVLGNVVLNEIAADNAGSVTNGGLFPDWIELQNRGATATNLAGWSLSDNSNARQFVFPANTVVAAGGYLVVWCDTATNAPGLHAGFSLGKSGETVSLFDATTNRADALTFGLQLTDKTVGRIADTWQLTTPTPGAANLAATTAAVTNLTLNEWLANPDVGGSDWIEVFNRSSNAPVALHGVYLGTSNAVFHYAALSFVAPRGYAQLFCEEQPGADQVEFKLPAAGGSIFLASPTGSELERVSYFAQTAGISEGRLPDGAANFASFAGSSSPGASNYVLAYTGPLLNEILARNDRAVVSPWGTAADFIELFNPGGSAVNLTGMAVGDSGNFGHAWKFPSGSSIAAGGHLTVWCDGARAASTAPTGPHSTGFSLSGESGQVYLFNPAGQPVDWVNYGFQVEDLPLGRNSGAWQLLVAATPGSANAAPASLGDIANLRLNEWMAGPLTGDDWFELYNTNTLPVDLSGLYLSDSPAVQQVTNSPVAPLSFVGGRKWVLFRADGNLSAGLDHANFSLDQQGESLRLYTTNLEVIDVIDFGLQTDGASQGRLPDGSASIVSFPTTPTPGAANFLPIAGLVVNEILTHTDPPLEDAVEFFNPTAGAINIGGWYLSDSASELKRYRIPDGTTVPAGGFKVFYQYQFGPTNTDDDAPPLFTFNSAHGDAVYLSQTDGSGNLTGYRLAQAFDAAANGVAFGRYVTTVGVDFVALSARTFGADNPANLAQFRAGAGKTNAFPLVGPVVINEIMYHPPDYGTNAPDQEEFIELLNLTSTNVALFDPAHPTNTWRLANAVSFDFAANQTLAAGARLLVVGFNPTNTTLLNAFRARYGTNGTVVGPFAGQLDNAGESIELWRPDAPQTAPHPDVGYVPQILVERVTYADTLPWPTNADGGGASLQRLAATSYGNDPVNWKAAAPTAGLANSVPSVGTVTLPGGGIVRLAFPVEPGRTYQVQYKNDLTDAQWLAMGSSVLATGDTLAVEDNLSAAPRRFYRLIVWP